MTRVRTRAAAAPCGPRIILITDTAYDDDAIVTAVQRAAAVLPRGALAVQLRDKTRSHWARASFAARLRAVTTAAGAPLIINGDPKLAKDVEADGVHLGAGATRIDEARAIFGAGGWISVAAHSDDDVRAAARDAVDAVLVSPIFVVHGKAAPRGLAAIQAADRIALGAPAVYALGGVGPSNARACVDAGAYGVAAIRALLASPHIEDAAAALFRGIAGSPSGS